MTGNDRRSQVLGIVRHSREPLDDDQLAAAAQMNRVYVNQLCRQLAAEGLVVRQRGGDGKLVNVATAGHPASAANPLPASQRLRPRQRLVERRAERVEKLIANFAAYVAAFETSEAFPGPSLYFHLRAIERRRQHGTVASLLEDIQFLEYAYAVLPAWGMHRMGPQAAKVGDFTAIITALRQQAPALQDLWPHHRALPRNGQASSRDRVAGHRKMLHHLLPDLIPPIDRQYTFSFFTGQKMVASDHAAFLDWFPQFATIGARCQAPIRDALGREGFMATGEAKVIDNAIMGFMQQLRLPAV
jgi:hypothetical protein